MKSYTDNIIFWDTEFSSLNPYEGELLSIGMIKPNGEELYLEIEHEGDVHPWVQSHVVPYLTGKTVSREEAKRRITEFVGSDKPFMVAYANYFDVVYLYKIFGVSDNTKDFPFHWIHIDFSSMLFAMGIDPQKFSSNHPNSLAKEFGIDTTVYRKHHALDDVKLLRDVYNHLVE